MYLVHLVHVYVYMYVTIVIVFTTVHHYSFFIFNTDELYSLAQHSSSQLAPSVFIEWMNSCQNILVSS
jgi:hypothetical protein